MRNKTAKLLRRRALYSGALLPAHAYQVVPHTFRQKEYREPWQNKEELPQFTYNTATLCLVPGCQRCRYQKAKRIYKTSPGPV